MRRVCSGDDPNLIGEDGEACRCGFEFDDVHRSTVYPHAAIWSQEAKRKLIERFSRDSDNGC